MKNSALKVKSQTKSTLSCCRAGLAFSMKNSMKKMYMFLGCASFFSYSQPLLSANCLNVSHIYKESPGSRNVSDQAAKWSVEGLRNKTFWSSRSANSTSHREINWRDSNPLISFWQKCGWEHRVPVRAYICCQTTLTTLGTTSKVEQSLTPGQQPQRCYQPALQVFIVGGREEHKHFGFSAVIATPDHHIHSPQPMTK